MAIVNGKELKRNVHLKTFNFWVKNRFKGDVEQVSKLLKISRKMAGYALNYGYVNFEDIHKITKFYEEKIKEVDDISKEDLSKIECLISERIYKKPIAKAFKISVDAVTIIQLKLSENKK